MAPLVTIGLPFHNESRYLPFAIRSMLRQTMSDFELLLVDDGSTDDSVALARSFDDPRIVVVSDGARRHLPARLNEITRRARGSLIARMDADDISHPTRLRAELDILEADPRCDAVGTLAAVVDEHAALLGIVGSTPLPVSVETALRKGLLVHPSMMARRTWMLANPYDEALTRAEDRDLWCRTAATTQFHLIDRPLHLLRVTARTDRFLASYLESHRQNRILFRRYEAGFVATAQLWLASYAKTLVMRGAARLGLADRVVRKRGRPPTAAERLLVAEAAAAAEADQGSQRP